ncbi:teichoic acid transport system ATP-binding protein [Sediminihabitans luteus]|uniref:Teichoic acid transport system ATP-binding protein n=1 Tax=Sediminihabitans luteus TaxID=1138585 RepID=A0A2M9CDP3_9CELL|nr:ABC transporter ATP-binding protein [Sediminihabitans luteus]PJJ69998.1 teichoic acid transport system ATP-binding protein [Sediminihabitans luteus]GII99319.1 teichoic acid ABC transporter ATP-binding protein [Sediminihabitans luteus]
MTDDDAGEIDFEIDPEDLEGDVPVVAELGKPSLVVDDVHITYRVFGATKLGSRGAEDKGFLQRILDRRPGVGSGVREVKAIKGVSFVARHGESIGIVGINGSGKSTLLRAVAGLIPPTQGAVYVAGEPSLLGVNAVLMGSLTGERNIMIGGLALGLTEAEVREKFDEIVEFSGIGDSIYLPMKAYSSGMGARLRFAISSAATPDILMIDEALATGDATFRQKSKSRIDQVRAGAGTVFLVSHSIATVQSICTRVLWIHEGELVMDGPTDEVCAAYKTFVRKVRDARSKAAAK